MKSAGSLIIAVTLLFTAGMRAQEVAVSAQEAAAPEKPYAGIVSRNMFGLVPIPPPVPVDTTPPVEPPPKITPNGIMTIFGRLQALFKVANKGKAGQPPKDAAYVLAEGERQDDITVVKINEVDRIITFNNHGTVQELPLVAAANQTAPAAAGAVPAAGVGAGFNPGMRPSGSMSPAERAALMRRAGGRTMSPGGSDNANNTGNPNLNNMGNANLNSGGPISQIYQPKVENDNLSGEERILLLEAKRRALAAQGDPTAPLFPTTRYSADP